MENPEGGRGHTKNPFREGGMDIFWNHTMLIAIIYLILKYATLLPMSQPSKDARLARQQRIVPREELLMQKNSRSAFESVSVRCKM